ncbi:glycosyltransferase family 4 protein [Enterobacter sichuanensis]
MKVIFSANTSWYLYNFRKTTIQRFVAEGHDVHIIAPDDVYTDKLIALGVKKHNLFLSGNSLNPFLDAMTAIHLFILYLMIRPRVIYNFTPKINIYSTFICYLLPYVKVINNIAGLGTAFIDNGYKKILLQILYKLSQNRADMVFFQNEEDMAYFINNKIIKTDKVSRIFGSGVNLDAFTPSRMFKGTEVKFILVARLIEHKGVRLYAEAARVIKDKYPHSNFALLGPIPENNPASIKPDEISLWVENGCLDYLGHSDNVAEVLEQYDCVVLPSFYREGVPKSLLEAAACGKIIVTTNNIGCKDAVVDGETGYICEPKSQESLISALEKVLHLDSKDFVEMKINARMLAQEKFDEKINIDKYLNTI